MPPCVSGWPRHPRTLGDGSQSAPRLMTMSPSSVVSRTSDIPWLVAVLVHDWNLELLLKPGHQQGGAGILWGRNVPART